MKWMLGIVVSLLASFGLMAETDLRFALGQKQILDMRYFCVDGTASEKCRTPVTQLSTELKTLISQHQLGGVILFAENIESTEQVRTLVAELQSTAKNAGLPPLFIAIDQEGGRVSRLPMAMTNAFSGNMAIGATFEQHGTAYATEVNNAIAQQLRALTINLNFAPTVDVNSNPDNPVINVRSYGENPDVVAQLGKAAVAALQTNGIMAAMKHFPGHGDTHVDSHTGLPKVDHAISTITAVDLLPFQKAIAASNASTPEMIMTAHIQFPALDNTKLLTRDGKPAIVPATLSNKILTELLRERLGFKGVVITDALDMAGIAHYMAPAEALLTSYHAGVDIALMPFTIRTPEDLAAYGDFMQRVTNDIAHYQSDKSSSIQRFRVPSRAQIERSLARVLDLKARYLEFQNSGKRLLSQVPRYAGLDQKLANDAITLVKNKLSLPLNVSADYTLIMPDNARCEAMQNALKRHQFSRVDTCFNLANEIDVEQLNAAIKSADGIIIGDISPTHSMAEMGGMEDKIQWQNRADKAAQYSVIESALTIAKRQHKSTTVIAFRAPYVLQKFNDQTDLAVAAYDYRVYIDKNKQARGVMFDTVAAILAGETEAAGHLPVTIMDTQ